MKKVQKIIQHKEEGKAKKFFKKLLKTAPGLKPYVKQRLRVICAKGYIPENMYDADGIIDDVFIELYHGDEIYQVQGLEELQLLLFKKTNAYIKEIIKRESFHKDSISTDKILQRELNRLRERYTFDADMDPVMNEELSDISYRQKDFKKEMFLYDDNRSNTDVIFRPEIPMEKRNELISRIYRFLSPETSNVVDLHVFGGLSIYQIASIKQTDERIISDIIESVKDNIDYAMGKYKD